MRDGQRESRFVCAQVGQQTWLTTGAADGHLPPPPPQHTPKQPPNTATTDTHVLLLHRALLAVIGIAHARPPTDDAAPLIGAVVALVTHAHERGWAHERVADRALAIALFAQAPDGC